MSILTITSITTISTITAITSIYRYEHHHVYACTYEDGDVSNEGMKG